ATRPEFRRRLFLLPSSRANALTPRPPRRYVAASVPTVAASSAAGSRAHGASLPLPPPPALYSMLPSRSCCSPPQTLKSRLKSLPSEDAQGNVHPIRRLYACSFARGARDTAESVTSWLARWTATPPNPSAIAEQCGHPAV